MSVRRDLNGESRRTLLLYCPYDRKVTRHARRGAGNELTCLECGRKLDASPPAESRLRQEEVYAQRTAPVPRIAEPARPARLTPKRAQRWRGRGLRAVLAGAALVVGTLAVINVIARIAAPAPSSADVVAGTAPAAVDTLRIANTDGLGAYLRRTPNLEDRLRAWPDGTRLKVAGADTTANGIEWKQVQDPAGNHGWIPAQYTSPEPRG